MSDRFKTFTFWSIFIFLGLAVYSLASGHNAFAAAHAPDAGKALPLIGVAGITQIRNLFSREAIIRYLQILGPQFPTVVMDTVFKDRPQQPGPLIGSDIIRQSVKAMPLARRGSRSINMSGATGTTEFYEPLPIHPDIAVTGAELNNLRMYMQNGPNSKELLTTWAQTKTDVLRRIVRNTTEAMCAVALSGKLVWPVAIEGGGFDTYEVDFGNNLSVDASAFKYWDDANIKAGDIQGLLIAISVLFQENGTGQQKIYWAGKDAFLALFAVVSKIYTTSKLPMNITETAIDFNGTKIELRSEKYWDPKDKVFKDIVPTNMLRVIDTAAGHRMPYAAVDDLDANLQPMPFFIKPLKTENPSGYSLIAESKPLPVINTLGICDVVVITPV
jgi:hypothetical protein